jgi:hypothetical protein
MKAADVREVLAEKFPREDVLAAWSEVMRERNAPRP